MPKRSLIFGGLGIVAVVAMLLFMLDPSSQTVLRKAQRKLVAEKTMRLDIEAALALPPEKLGSELLSSATGVDISLRVDLDRTAPLNPSSVSTFSFAQGSGKSEVKLFGEARRMDSKHYIKLDEASALSSEISTKVKGKWLSSDHPFSRYVFPPDERSLAERPLDTAGLSGLTQAFNAVDLFRVTDKKPDVELDGVKTRHYAVEVNLETVSALLLKSRFTRTGVPITSEDVLVVTASLIRWGQPVGEVWIDKRTGKFLKIALVSAMDAGESSGAVGGTLVFSNYGRPIKVDVPQATDIETELGPIFSKKLNLSSGRKETVVNEPVPKANEASGTIAAGADSDGDGLSDSQEGFYGSDAWNPDTDGDGWSDGFEVNKGMNPAGAGSLFGFGL